MKMHLDRNPRLTIQSLNITPDYWFAADSFNGIGVAVPDSLWEFRIHRLKELDSNAYRCAHNPPTSEETLKRLDEIFPQVALPHVFAGSQSPNRYESPEAFAW